MTSPSLAARRWSSWARDAFERAVKTAIQVVGIGVAGELADLAGAVQSSPAEYMPTSWLVAAPVVGFVLSWLSSLVSKRFGSPSTARFNG